MSAKIKSIINNWTGKLAGFLFPLKSNNYRAGIFDTNFLVIFLFVLIAVKAVSMAFFATFPENVFFADITKYQIIDLANSSRRENGLRPLSENSVLDRAAYMKALDMFAKGYFDHTSPQGISPWYWFGQSGYQYRYAGENLAIGFIESGEVNNAWMDSPAHKANIINNHYNETGIAVVNGNFQGTPTTIVVQLFGTKKPIQTAKIGESRHDNDNIGGTGAGEQDMAVAALNSQPAAQKVLGAYDIALSTRAAMSYPDKDSFFYRITNFFNENYFILVQRIMYGAIFFVVILLAANFAMKADFEHRDMLFKAAGFLVLATIFLAMDKQMIISLIPHLTTIN